MNLLPSSPCCRCVLAVSLMSFANLGLSDDWGQFLGSDRNGISSETGLIDGFRNDKPQEIWRVAGGVGMSGIAVCPKHAITMWNSSDGEAVVSLDPNTGRTNWLTTIGAPFRNAMGDGPRATPTIVGDRVYAYGGGGQLAALNLTDGKEIWSTNVPANQGGKPAEYGMASSPLVIDDIVIVTCGGAGSAVVALNVADGSVRWTAIDGAAGYSSPAVLRVGEQKQLVTFTAAGAAGLDSSSGEVLWSYPFKTPYDCNTATPISINGRIFISAGENHGCVLLEVTRNGDQYVVNEVWESTTTKSVMRNEWQTSISLDGYLYGFDNVGSAGPTTHLTCIEADTGKVVWREARFGKGNLVAADGKLWISTMKGEVVIVKASPAGYEEMGRVPLMKKTRQSLALSAGHAYLRDDQQVVCISLREQ